LPRRGGRHVWASTGKDARDFLLGLGARDVLSREETTAEGRPLEGERWAACVDPVGGPSLAYALRTLRYGGAVASSGNSGGVELHTTVFPFILRGVALLGIDSAQTSIARRRDVWQRLADDLRPVLPDEGTREVTLDELDGVLDATLRGEGFGRTVVRVSGAS
jgi:acrylyl-CoA reductase (NADPH)